MNAALTDKLTVKESFKICERINPGDPVALLQVSEYMYEWGKAQGLRDCEEFDSQ